MLKNPNVGTERLQYEQSLSDADPYRTIHAVTSAMASIPQVDHRTRFVTVKCERCSKPRPESARAFHSYTDENGSTELCIIDPQLSFKAGRISRQAMENILAERAEEEQA